LKLLFTLGDLSIKINQTLKKVQLAHHETEKKDTYAHEDVHANCGRKDSRATPRWDFADVAYNFHRLAALSERSDNTLFRLEERSLINILYMEEGYP